MLAELKFESVLNNTRYRLIDFKNVLPKNKLPKEYFEEAPYFWLSTDTENICLVVNKWLFNAQKNIEVRKGLHEYILFKGMSIANTNLSKLISVMKQAGQRLADINKAERETFTITI